MIPTLFTDVDGAGVAVSNLISHHHDDLVGGNGIGVGPKLLEGSGDSPNGKANGDGRGYGYGDPLGGKTMVKSSNGRGLPLPRRYQLTTR